MFVTLCARSLAGLDDYLDDISDEQPDFPKL
jgi:hypothetical protein